MIRAIFLKGSGIRELWPQFLLLAGMAGFGVLFAVRRFKRTL